MFSLSFSAYEKDVEPVVRNAVTQFFKTHSHKCSCGHSRILNATSTGVLGVYIYVSRGNNACGAYVPIISENIDADKTVSLFFEKLVELSNSLPDNASSPPLMAEPQQKHEKQ